MAVGDRTIEQEVGVVYRGVSCRQGERSNDLWKPGEKGGGSWWNAAHAALTSYERAEPAALSRCSW